MAKPTTSKRTTITKKNRKTPQLGVGSRSISKYSPCKLKARRGLHLRLSKFLADVKKTEETKKLAKVAKTKSGANDKKPIKRYLQPSFYPMQVLRHYKRGKVIKRKSSVEKLRSSIKFGTILILLTTKHRGKRVVFLRQLKQSGMLLVTGPYKFNRVPLKRVHQSQVIATSTKLKLANSIVYDKFTDKYFNDLKKQIVKNKTESSKKTSPERKASQKAVDKDVLAAAGKVKFMRKYLSSKFTLKRGQYPHNMVF